jgi:hypothetical protein
MWVRKKLAAVSRRPDSWAALLIHHNNLRSDRSDVRTSKCQTHVEVYFAQDKEPAMKIVSCGVVLAVLAAASPFARQTPIDAFTIYGAGTASCGSWTEHLNDKNLHALDLHWVFGFVSAAGVFAGVQLKGDANSIEPFMTKYCAEHPLETITTAAANLVGSLRQ